MSTITEDTHLHIGSLIFPQIDQADFTGPFEVLSRIPNSTHYVIAKEKKPLRDVRGLILSPEYTFSEVGDLDVLHVPGGMGQEELMDDDETLTFVRQQASVGRYVFSVCTGALILGAAGLLKGRNATTHWAAFHLLHYFGAIPVNRRVVSDRSLVTTAGVTAGIDGALEIATLLRGEQKAQEIQLYLQYAPDPPFRSGTPESASPTVLTTVRGALQSLSEARLVTAKRISQRLGISSLD